VPASFYKVIITNAGRLAVAGAALFAACGGDVVTEDRWFYITADETDLPSNNVYGVYVAAGDAWYATDKGLAYNRGTTWRVYRRAEGLPSNLVFDVVVLPNGDIWAATAGGAVRLRAGGLTVFTTADGLPSDRVVAVAYDGAKVWFATDAGLARYNDPTFTVFGAEQGLPGDDVRDVYAAGREKIWAACIGGAAFYDWGNVTAYTVANAGLPSHYVYAVAARGENAWLGTDKGLAQLVGGRVVKTFTTANSGLRSDVINDIGYAAAGELWVGTAAGASRGRGGTFQTFDEKTGLLSPYVLAVWGDKLGYVWLGTLGGGVNRFND